MQPIGVEILPCYVDAPIGSDIPTGGTLGSVKGTLFVYILLIASHPVKVKTD
jgi:hypothetical protein